MIVEQTRDCLTIQQDWSLKANLASLGQFGLACVFCWVAVVFQQSESLLCAALFAVLAVLLGLAGCSILFSRPDTLYFDRSTGYLSILHRKLGSQEIENYRLQDIQSVLIEVDYRLREKESEVPPSFAYLIVKEPNAGSSPKERRLSLPVTDGEMAAIASFLSIPLERKTIQSTDVLSPENGFFSRSAAPERTQSSDRDDLTMRRL